MSARSAARRALLVGAGAVLGRLVTTTPGLRLVNRVHRSLSLEQKRRFFHAFVEAPYAVQGRWVVDFAGRPIVLPLRRDFGLSWCVALGFHGYDPEVHQFYEWLVRSPRRPRVFFDVGANYGAHALRFLRHGIRTVVFEPNAACHAYFEEACALNDVSAKIETVVLADRPGSAQLWIPQSETYLATVVPEVRAQWRDRTDVMTIKARQTTLDRFVGEYAVAPDLIKIDTEGSELAVLRGTRGLLARPRPLVVFESWPTSGDRAAIFDLMADADYEIQPLASPFREAPGVGRPAFMESPVHNFLARPKAAGPLA
jgi:FkbM family methyltransferase